MFNYLSFSQNIERVNTSFNIPNELKNKDELRIYTIGLIDEDVELIRIYYKDKWIKEKFEYDPYLDKGNPYSTTIEYVEDENSEIEILTIEHREKEKELKGFENIWLEVISTNILRVKEINTKISKAIKKEKNYSHIMDGVHYIIEIKRDYIINKITIDNPSHYYHYFKDIKDLNSVIKFLNIYEKKILETFE